MASAEHLKALLKAYGAGDHEHFIALASDVAAREAKRGHSKLAEELKILIDQAKGKSQGTGQQKLVAIAQPKGELAGLLTVSFPKYRLSDLILSDDLRDRLLRIVQEQRFASRIRSHGLHPRRKILFVGPPGTGKTMSAAVLAGELGLPLFVVRLERLITKFMGETAAKLRLIFDNISQVRGVYLFDEFDSIGSQRGIRNDVGEIRRVLNSFLQFIEGDNSQSLILGATNHPDLLDDALFRRFDDVIEYQVPPPQQVERILQRVLAGQTKTWTDWEKLASYAVGMSHAEITKAAEDAIKHVVVTEKSELTEADVMASLQERKSIRRK